MQTPSELVQQLTELSQKLAPNQLVEMVINGEIAGIVGKLRQTEKREWARRLRHVFPGPADPLIDLNSANDLVFESKGVLFHYIHDDEVPVQPIREVIMRIYTSKGGKSGVVSSDLPD